ncbi:MAG: L,D-transpeptidase family protein [Verrucomicrobiota bacterium]|nr:L,D-transpeptidase family protein [Verrucomicrobiota bacterium]
MKLHLDSIENFRRPSRKPWLVLAVLLIAGAVVALRHLTRWGWPAFGSGGQGTNTTASAAGQGERPAVSEQPLRLEKASNSGRPQVPPPPVPPVTPTGADSRLALDDARALQNRDDLLQAREKYLWILANTRDAAVRTAAEGHLGQVNVELVFSSRAMPEKTEYVVKKGDYLQKIAQEHGTTVELIERANGIRKGGIIKAGDLLKVLSGKFSVTVSRGRNDLVLRLNDRFFRRYRVGTGKEDKTPLGTFTIAGKDVEPVWWPHGREIPYGHPDNILGTRWMALDATGETPKVKGYGIHGTWDDAGIGKSVSAGCIRMANRDVEDLFAMVTIGTPVTITE